MKRKRIYLPWSILVGLLFILSDCDGLKGTSLVLSKIRAKSTTAPPVTEERPNEEEEIPAIQASSTEGDVEQHKNNTSTKSPLTGIPQIDYKYDPNLPRELNGYNLKEYPFYDRVPEEIDFKCDGLHDGFYASVPHKCQVYHHCLFGTRYDFLCANYTAFDQKTFICHFVSEVDCANSPKYYKRNEALYKQDESKTSTTTTTTTTTTTAAPPPVPQPPVKNRRPFSPAGRRRRPYRRRRPVVYEYYYDDEYDDDEYYDDDFREEVPSTTTTTTHAPPPQAGSSAGGRRRRKRPRPIYNTAPAAAAIPPSAPTQDAILPERRPEYSGSPQEKPRPTSVYDRPRIPPKIRRPVPVNEREKYAYVPKGNGNLNVGNTAEGAVNKEVQQPRPKPLTRQTTTPYPEDYDYYEDEYDYELPVRKGQSQIQQKHRVKPQTEAAPAVGNADYDLRRPSAPSSNYRRPVQNQNKGIRKPQKNAAYQTSSEEFDEYGSSEEDLKQPVRQPSNSGRNWNQQNSWKQRQTESPPANGNDYSKPQQHSQRHHQPQRDGYQEKITDSREEPIPAPRPAYISPTASGRPAYVVRKRVPVKPEIDYSNVPKKPETPELASSGKTETNKKPSTEQTYKNYNQQTDYLNSGYDDDSSEYYDDDELEEEPVTQKNSQNYRYRSQEKEEKVISKPVPEQSTTSKRPYLPKGTSQTRTENERVYQSSGKSQASRTETSVDRPEKLPYKQKYGQTAPEDPDISNSRERIVQKPDLNNYRQSVPVYQNEQPERSVSFNIRTNHQLSGKYNQQQDEDSTESRETTAVDPNGHDLQLRPLFTNGRTPQAPYIEIPYRQVGSLGYRQSPVSFIEQQVSFTNGPTGNGYHGKLQSASEEYISGKLKVDGTDPNEERNFYQQQRKNSDDKLSEYIEASSRGVSGVRPTEKNSAGDKYKLDNIDEHEYDVTLNEALHPNVQTSRIPFKTHSISDVNKNEELLKSKSVPPVVKYNSNGYKSYPLQYSNADQIPLSSYGSSLPDNRRPFQHSASQRHFVKTPSPLHVKDYDYDLEAVSQRYPDTRKQLNNRSVPNNNTNVWSNRDVHLVNKELQNPRDNGRYYLTTSTTKPSRVQQHDEYDDEYGSYDIEDKIQQQRHRQRWNSQRTPTRIRPRTKDYGY